MTDFILVDVGTFFVGAHYFLYTTLYDITVTQKDYYTTLHFHITTADISTKHQQFSPALALSGAERAPEMKELPASTSMCSLKNVLQYLAFLCTTLVLDGKFLLHLLQYFF